MSNRDYVMARLAALRVSLVGASAALDECLELFVTPGEDEKGNERNETLELLSDFAGDMSRSIELAQRGMEEITKDELKEEEEDPEEASEQENDDD